MQISMACSLLVNAGDRTTALFCKLELCWQIGICLPFFPVLTHAACVITTGSLYKFHKQARRAVPDSTIPGLHPKMTPPPSLQQQANIGSSSSSSSNNRGWTALLWPSKWAPRSWDLGGRSAQPQGPSHPITANIIPPPAPCQTLSVSTNLDHERCSEGEEHWGLVHSNLVSRVSSWINASNSSKSQIPLICMTYEGIGTGLRMIEIIW